MNQGGKWLMVFVGGVLLLALGIFVSLVQIDRTREARRSGKSDSPTRGKSRAAAADSEPLRGQELLRAAANMDKLIIPPPDEARIEAIAPKNDTVRRR